MNVARSRALWGALPLAIITALALLAPWFIQQQITKRLAQYPEVQIDDLRVSLRWNIHIRTLNFKHPSGAAECTDLTLQPALWANLRQQANTPRLQHVNIAHCVIHLTSASQDTAKDTETQKSLSLQERIQYLTDALDRALRHVHALRIQQLDGVAHIRKQSATISAQALTWNYTPEQRRLHTTLSVSAPISIPIIRVETLWEHDDTSVHIEFPTPIDVEHWRIHPSEFTLQNGRTIRLPNLSVSSRGDDDQKHYSSVLSDISIDLTSPPNVMVEQGTVHLPALDIASLWRANQPSKEVSDPPDAFDPKQEDREAARHQDFTHPDIWSLRTLERARRAVQKLQTFSVLESAEWLAYFDVHNIDVLHNGNTLMHIEKVQLQPDLPLTFEAQISNARVSLRADTHPPERWTLSVRDASLQRIAAFFELEQHLQGRTNATLRLHIQDNALNAEGDFTVYHAMLTHEKVSELPVGPLNIQGTLHAVLSSDPSQEASVESDVSVNSIPLRFELRATPDDTDTRFFGTLGLSRSTRCQDIWMAIPSGLLPDMGHAALQFQGAMQTRLNLAYVGGRFDTFTLRSEGFPGDCSIRGLDAYWHPGALVDANYVHHVQEGVTRDDIYVGPGTGEYVAIETLPAYVPALMYLSEEIAFYDNHAVSIGLINRGIRHSLPRKRFAYGGSTVTQQLVKNLYFSRTKRLSRKFQEAFIAWAMIETLTKDQILELYINCIEFGPDLYGIVRASRYYFGKPPQELTALEAAWLASLKPSPRRGERDFRRGYSDYANWNSERIETLLRRVVQYTEALSADDVEAAAPFVVYFPTSPNAGARPAHLLTKEHTIAGDKDTQ